MREKYHSLNIEVDGGVGPKTIRECVKVRWVPLFRDMYLVLRT